MSWFGWLTRYEDGTILRPATAAEWLRTAQVMNSSLPYASTGAWLDKNGSSVYVDGGPDMTIGEPDIAVLQREAVITEDRRTADLAAKALDPEVIDDDADNYCIQLILENRMRAEEKR